MEEFYEVLWNGSIHRYNKVETKEKGNWYHCTNLMVRNDNDDWAIDINKPTCTLGRRCLSDNYISKHFKDKTFILTIDDCIEKSKKLWDDYYAPKAMWQVVEIFDDVEVKPISKPLPRIEAKRELEKYKNRPYVSYDIRKTT